MNRYLLLPLLGLMLAGPAAVAQTDVGQTGAAGQANLNTLTAGAPTMTPRGTSDGLRGTPYADNQWRMAKITLSNKLPLAPVPLKYDVLDQRLLMRKEAPSRDSLQLDDRLVQQFILLPLIPGGVGQPRTFRRFAEASTPADRASYVEVLHEGHYTLLKRHRKIMKKANLQGAYNAGERFDEIEDNSEYFLRAPDATIQSIKQLSLKSLQTAAPALSSALKTAATSRKTKTDEDWTAILAAADPAAK